jgi:hypothetical protein
MSTTPSFTRSGVGGIRKRRSVVRTTESLIMLKYSKSECWTEAGTTTRTTQRVHARSSTSLV